MFLRQLLLRPGAALYCLPLPPSWLLGRGGPPPDVARWTCTCLYPSPLLRPLHTSPRAMERPDQSAAPPPKRRRSTEEEGGGRGGGKEEGRSRGKKWGAPRGHTPNGGGGVVSARARDGEEEDRGAGGGGGALRPSRSREAQEAGHKPLPPNPALRGGETGGSGPAEERPRRDLPRDPSNPWRTAGAGKPPPPPRAQGAARPSRPLQRQWEAPPACSTSLQPPGASSAFDFSVLSYNILSQDLLRDNAYLYRHCDPAVLHWAHRLPRLLAEIQHYSADILCLQEVQHDHYESQIKPVLQALGYQCVYKKRTGSKPDGLAVAFRTSRLALLGCRPVEFLRAGDALLDRDNVGLVVLLQPSGQSGPSAPPPPSVCVANTHLLYNPRRGDVKLAQLAILLAEVQRLARLPDGSSNPVLLCGDLNSAPWSPLYHFLTTGRLHYQGLAIGTVSGQEDSPRGQRLLESPIWSNRLGINQRCCYDDQPLTDPNPPPGMELAISSLSVEDPSIRRHTADESFRIEHGVRLQSSYQHVLMHDGRPEITTCHSRVAMTVDYILYTPDSSPPSPLPCGRGLQLLGRLSLVGQSELEEASGLPNQHHPSDHLPLLARFRLRR